MSIFLDTSAFLAVLDADDSHHEKAERIWASLINEKEVLVTSNYVLLETTALLQNRFGIEAVKIFYMDIFPLLTVLWVEKEDHQAAVLALIASGRKKMSLVDQTSFQFMRKLGIKKAFSFDRHFSDQGFHPL